MKANLIKEKFKNKYGLLLEQYLEASGVEQDEVVRFFNRQKEIVEEYCKSVICTFNSEKLSPLYYDKFETWVFEQMYYVLNTYDYTIVAGIDVGTNSTLPLQELVNRYLSPFLKYKINNSGVLFRGLW